MDKTRAVDAVTTIAIFKGRQVRRVLHEGEWWFSVVDVVGALTDSENPRDYWFKMKIREKDESGIQLSTICRQLKLESADGKKYETDCADTEGVFRIVQSIPSPKAEPFKMDDFELIFNMLGERATTEIHRQEDSQGVPKLKSDAHDGGTIAGNARKALEKRLKRSVVSSGNYLRQGEEQNKRLRN